VLVAAGLGPPARAVGVEDCIDTQCLYAVAEAVAGADVGAVAAGDAVADSAAGLLCVDARAG
jgi:hypothetical protein